MPKRKKDSSPSRSTAATVGYEAELWQMADALRGSMDAAEYKHVVLGLIFLKYISDAFEEQHAKLEAERAHGADPEDPDEYRGAEHPIFWVPPEAHWPHLKSAAKQPTIGELVDDAMGGIERDNPALKGVLPRDYARPALDKLRLGQLIDLVSNIKIGDADSRAKDVLGRVYGRCWPSGGHGPDSSRQTSRRCAIGNGSLSNGRRPGSRPGTRVARARCWRSTRSRRSPAGRRR